MSKYLTLTLDSRHIAESIDGRIFVVHSLDSEPIGYNELRYGNSKAHTGSLLWLNKFLSFRCIINPKQIQAGEQVLTLTNKLLPKKKSQKPYKLCQFGGGAFTIRRNTEGGCILANPGKSLPTPREYSRQFIGHYPSFAEAAYFAVEYSLQALPETIPYSDVDPRLNGIAQSLFSDLSITT